MRQRHRFAAVLLTVTFVGAWGAARAGDAKGYKLSYPQIRKKAPLVPQRQEGIRLLSPAKPGQFMLGQPITIRFKAAKAVRKVRVQLSLDAGRSWSDVGMAWAQAGKFVLRLPGDARLATKEARIRLSDARAPDTAVLSPQLILTPKRLSGSGNGPRPRPVSPLTITSPVGTILMTNGHRYVFEFQAGEDIRRVRAKLSFDDGRTWTVLEENIPAEEGRFVYFIDEEAVMHTDRGRIRIESMDHGAIGDTTDRLIIEADRPENRRIHLTSPTRDWSGFAGARMTVRWTCPRRMQERLLRLEYSFDNMRTWHAVPLPGPIAASSGSVDWLVPVSDDHRTARVRLVAADRRPMHPVVSNAFTLLPQAPQGYNNAFRDDVIRVLSPGRGQSYPLGGRMDILWEAAEDIDRVSIYFLPSRGCMADEWIHVATVDGDAGEYSWRIPDDRDLFTRDGSILIRNASNINEVDRTESFSLLIGRELP